jgi:hypothetical protein
VYLPLLSSPSRLLCGSGWHLGFDVVRVLILFAVLKVHGLCLTALRRTGFVRLAE